MIKSGRPGWRARRDGRKPGSDPRYSCGWHYRKNTFNKERRQFEKMSSFETQAAGWRASVSPAPSAPSRHPGTPRLLGALPLPSLPAVSGTRTGVPGSAAACFGVTPPKVSPARPASKVSQRRGFPCGSGVSGPRERGPPRACAGCELGARARASVSRSDSRLGSSALAGPPVASFPVLSPGPHRVETGYLVKRCFWPSRRRGDGRRKAPSPEFFSIKSDKKFREK